MKKFKSTLETEIEIIFTDPESAEKCFCGKDWRNIFWDLDDLQEVAEHLSESFQNTPDEWSNKDMKIAKFIEGFGTFIEENGYYTNTPESQEGGKIKIKVLSELQPIWCDEI